MLELKIFTLSPVFVDRIMNDEFNEKYNGYSFKKQNLEFMPTTNIS